MTELTSSDPEWLQHFELLVRSILVRPEMPAVIVLGHFSPQIQAAHGFAGPELLHNVVAQFYDVPHIRCVSVFPLPFLGSLPSRRHKSSFHPNPSIYPTATSLFSAHPHTYGHSTRADRQRQRHHLRRLPNPT
jgi:hypothetical protein